MWLWIYSHTHDMESNEFYTWAKPKYWDGVARSIGRVGNPVTHLGVSSQWCEVCDSCWMLDEILILISYCFFLFRSSSGTKPSNKMWNLKEVFRLLIGTQIWEFCTLYSVTHTNSHTKREPSGRFWGETEHLIVALPSPPHVPPPQPVTTEHCFTSNRGFLQGGRWGEKPTPSHPYSSDFDIVIVEI